MTDRELIELVAVAPVGTRIPDDFLERCVRLGAPIPTDTANLRFGPRLRIWALEWLDVPTE